MQTFNAFLSLQENSHINCKYIHIYYIYKILHFRILTQN